MPKVTYKGPMDFGHSPPGGSGLKYMFMVGEPVPIDNELDIAAYTRKAERNPETWTITWSPKERAAEYIKNFWKKLDVKRLKDLKVSQLRTLAEDLELDSTGKESELLTRIMDMEEAS